MTSPKNIELINDGVMCVMELIPKRYTLVEIETGLIIKHFDNKEQAKQAHSDYLFQQLMAAYRNR